MIGRTSGHLIRHAENWIRVGNLLPWVDCSWYLLLPPGAEQDLSGEGQGGQEQARKLRDFFTALALCHTVIPERFEDTDEV